MTRRLGTGSTVELLDSDLPPAAEFLRCRFRSRNNELLEGYIKMEDYEWLEKGLHPLPSPQRDLPPTHLPTLNKLLGRMCGSPEEANLILGRILPEYSRVYSLEPQQYGLRGGHMYHKPCGWLRFAVAAGRGYDHNWCVAYHGTRHNNIPSILQRGLLRPGDGSVQVAHGQAHSTSGRSIYVSPSVEYAAFPVYSQFVEVGKDHWAQLVVQCRVCPFSFQEKPGSLGSKYWPEDLPIDPSYPTCDGLEWLIEDEALVVPTALLLREFGPRADPGLFGPIARKVQRGQQGPEYEWTRLRIEHMKRTIPPTRQPSVCHVM